MGWINEIKIAKKYHDTVTFKMLKFCLSYQDYLKLLLKIAMPY